MGGGAGGSDKGPDKRDGALLGESKGGVFEFLVGRSLAERLGSAAAFHRDVPGGLLARLSGYEAHIRRHDPALARALPGMALETASALLARLPPGAGRKGARLVGRAPGTAPRWGEADLVLEGGREPVGLSLKLYGAGNRVNTKSGGARSFIARYFPSFPRAPFLQDRLNAALDRSFDEMAQELHEMNGLPFEGGFHGRWAGPRGGLPGTLPPRERRAVHAFYHGVAGLLHEALTGMMAEDRRAFAESLLPLLGVSRGDVLQATCFHDRDASGGHVVTGVLCEDAGELRDGMGALSIPPFPGGRGYFDVRFPGRELQIRPKPMARFTVPALKVNCSLRMTGPAPLRFSRRRPMRGHGGGGR